MGVWAGLTGARTTQTLYRQPSVHQRFVRDFHQHANRDVHLFCLLRGEVEKVLVESINFLQRPRARRQAHVALGVALGGARHFHPVPKVFKKFSGVRRGRRANGVTSDKHFDGKRRQSSVALV